MNFVKIFRLFRLIKCGKKGPGVKTRFAHSNILGFFLQEGSKIIVNILKISKDPG